MGIKVECVEVDVSGEMDVNVLLGLKEGNGGFDEINVGLNVESEGDEAQVEQLIGKAIEI
uniref:OsmC family protein n=1 Tax=Paenibacillus xylanexedens TaxID=528191 RepID=UPI001C92D44F